MSEFFVSATWYLYGSMCVLLLLYGMNSYVLMALFFSQKARGKDASRRWEQSFHQKLAAGHIEWPRVLTQIPIYNEFNVAERILRAAAALDYPPHLHEIQVLDDSDDETCAAIDRVAAELRREGKSIQVIRRPHRQGYKAGALNEGLRHGTAEFIAIFDSDFVPNPDFLRRCLPALLEQPQAGLVQARWGHLNPRESALTRVLAIGIDGHFVVEQPARAWNQLFLNFNGTAGIWRRRAIEEAGGWQADTLTEDMDLSYRAQLAGWAIVYLPEVAAPAELPNSFSAFKSQQFRWAKGSIQTACKLLPRVLGAPLGWFRKVQSIFHLTHYFIHIFMVALAVLSLPLVFAEIDSPPSWMWVAASLIIALATLGPSLLYMTSQVVLDPRQGWKRLVDLPGLILIGFGISLSNAQAVLEALLGRKTAFIRTPKRGHHQRKHYRTPRRLMPWLEISLGLYCLLTFVLALTLHRPVLGPFIVIYICGYLLVGVASLREVRERK